MQASHITLFSVDISTLKKSEIISLIEEKILEGSKLSVFTPNTKMLLAAKNQEAIRKLLNRSNLNLPDGMGVYIAARVLCDTTLSRSGGIDIAEDIMKMAQSRALRVFLLGGKTGTASSAAKELKKIYPNLTVCGTHHGYFSKSGEQNDKVIKKINDAHPDILFVCFGFPKQEIWIDKNLARLSSVKLAMGLGGSLDVWAGNIRRAPRLMQKFGFEWLWRVMLEPNRASVFLDIPHFFFLLAAYKRRVLRAERRGTKKSFSSLH